jgi:hypothetical protein
MSRQLDKAREEYESGDYKKAVRLLWELPIGADDPGNVMELATMIRGKAEGKVAAECDEFLRSHQQAVAEAEKSQAAKRAQELETSLKADPAALARWAAQAGLGWLEIESSEDVVAASLKAAMAAAGRDQAPQPCMIDAVEAEGWRLEHVQHLFKPVKIQTTIFKGADLIGGEPVEGEMTYFYLFRRVDVHA